MSYTEQRPSKRQKVAHESPAQSTITSANHINQLLEYRQSTDDSVVKNLEAFKSHLVWVSQLENGSPEKCRHLQDLLEYSQWQKAATDDQLDFYDLLSTWSLAVEQNTNDSALALIPDILAHYLKAISSSLDFRPYGIALIDNLLRRDQSKLFGKGLAAAKNKPQLSAPCLRLLTEMAAFDGGVRAQAIWLRRDLFINRDALFSSSNGMKKQDQTQQLELIRPLTIILIVTLVKYLDATTKAEFISQGKALHGLLQGLTTDDPQNILSMLGMVDKYLISDRDIPRHVLQRFFNSVHLEYLSALYTYEAEDEQSDDRDLIREAVHKLLGKLCTTKLGILLDQGDWYPVAAIASSLQPSEDDYIDLGLDSLTFNDNYNTFVPVKNATLSNYIQKLKPFQDVLQSSLLVDILKAAPELVADYFSRRKQIPAPDSDDAAWRGAIAFLFSTIELPVPLLSIDTNMRSPPPTTIVIENIIPRPLDRSYFQKLMSSSDDILKITGARLLTTLLRKLVQVLKVLSPSTRTEGYLWNQAREKLIEITQARIPSIRDITLALQRTSSSDTDLYTVMLECFATYLKVLPSSSAMTTFDISPVMTELCSQLTKSELDADVREKISIQLGHCVKIAELTSATKWLQKSDADTLSSLGQLIKVVLAEGSANDYDEITQAIERVLSHNGILSNHQACLALFSSLRPKKKLRHFSPTNGLFLFLDNSIVKASQKPVKYLDEIEDAQQLLSDRKPSSLLVASICEQWTFLQKKYGGEKEVLKNLALFTAQLFSNLEKVGENFRVMQHFKERIENDCGEKIKKYLEDAFLKVSRLSAPTAFDKELTEMENSEEPVTQDLEETKQETTLTLDEFSMPPYQFIPVPTSLEGLDKWSSSTDFEVEIESNQLSRLIFVLSASEEELRIQALQLLQKVTHLVDTSSTNFDAKSQTFLLLSEFLETVKVIGLNTPVPTIVPQLAHQLLRLLIQPDNKMYVKANKFLLASPTWDVKRLIKYWADRILLRQPGADDSSSDAWNVETTWLLTLLGSSIRTEQDLELYRRSGIFERVMSLYASPVVGVKIRKMIIVMMWRVCEIRGGADTLWTRFGVHSWLQQICAVDAENEAMLRAFRVDLERQCDQTAMDSWKLGCALLGRDAVAVH